jgi:branched-chain amino acid transport system substrate-binding protein
VLAQGVELANSLDAGRVAEALRGSSVTTLLDDLSFDAYGDLINPQIWIYEVENDAFKQVSW